MKEFATYQILQVFAIYFERICYLPIVKVFAI
jgi:hypothetical protein